MDTAQENHPLLNNEREKLCQFLDEKGVPQNADWRSLFSCLYSQQLNESLTEEQKSHFIQLAKALLKKKDFSDSALQDALTTQSRILNAPCISDLHEAIVESEKMLQEFRELSMKRTGDVERLESTAVSTIENNEDPGEMIKKLRNAFRSVIDMMREDTENLEKLSRTDSLTGLGNRRAFDQFLQSHTMLGPPLCLLLLDIDHFKKFNDNFGHRIGDQALNTVAKILRDHMQQRGGSCGQDFLTARYGGEEFAVVIPGLTLKEAVNQAEEIKGKIESYSFVIRDIQGKIIHKEITITVSIGVSELKSEWTDALAEHLVEAADSAMYRAKTEGRNLVRY